MTGWRAEAVCSGMDRAMFYPDTYDAAGRRAAVAVCAMCPVTRPCAEDALAAGDDNGIWGGLTGQQRRAMRQARGRLERLADHGTDSRWATGCDCGPCSHAYERLVLAARASPIGSGTRQRKVRVDRGRRLSTGTTAAREAG